MDILLAETNAQDGVTNPLFGHEVGAEVGSYEPWRLREHERIEHTHRDAAQGWRAAPVEFSRIRWDTYLGMALSNLVALFIIVTCAATLNAHGVRDIQTSAQAALALKPIAGPAVFVVFALGVVGTGLLAVPVLAGSAAFAVGEGMRWHVGLARKFQRAKAFYGVIVAAIVVGAALNFTPIDPIKALFWTAVINGVVAVPVMAMMMLLSSKTSAMGEFTLPPILKVVGWIATAVMAIAVIGMCATVGQGG